MLHPEPNPHEARRDAYRARLTDVKRRNVRRQALAAGTWVLGGWTFTAAFVLFSLELTRNNVLSAGTGLAVFAVWLMVTAVLMTRR